jgi:glucokinase
MKKWLIGIDIGGTYIRICLGKLIQKKHGVRHVDRKILSSRKGQEPRRSINEIKVSVNQLLKAHQLHTKMLCGIGIAVAGAIDSEKGIILKSPNLKKWEGFGFQKSLSRFFQVPVYVENDANASALGEKHFGLGRKKKNFLYVTVSTGIGAGLVINGALVRGKAGTAGEMGHMTVQPNGYSCKCGKNGCLEAYASGTAIGNLVKRVLRKEGRSRFWKKFQRAEVTGKMVTQASLKGDRIAIKARKEAAEYLGIGLSSVINLLNPERIILGGGVLEVPQHFWGPMINRIRKESWPTAFKSCQILRSKLGKHVGDWGSFAIILERLS